MKIISTFPGSSNFHLFEDLSNFNYSDEELKLKKGETICLKHLIACFVLLEDSVPRARVALYQNPLLEFQQRKTACLGAYECINNNDVSNKILNYAMDQARLTDAKFIIGPMNGSTYESYRFSLNRDRPNFFLEPYHHLYYNDQFVHVGFKSIGEYHSLFDSKVIFKIDGTEERLNYFKSIGVCFRNVNLEGFSGDLKAIHALNQIAFKENFLYTPIEANYFEDKYLKTQSWIDPNFFILAFDNDDTLIGYYFCVQDYLNNQEKSLIIKSIARHPNPKWRGLGQVIGHEIYTRAKNQGFKSIIHAFMHNDGTSTPISNHFSKENYKNYRLYGRTL